MHRSIGAHGSNSPPCRPAQGPGESGALIAGGHGSSLDQRQDSPVASPTSPCDFSGAHRRRERCGGNHPWSNTAGSPCRSSGAGLGYSCCSRKTWCWRSCTGGNLAPSRLWSSTAGEPSLVGPATTTLKGQPTYMIQSMGREKTKKWDGGRTKRSLVSFGGRRTL